MPAATTTPAIASKALTWFRYDVHAQASACELLSIPARGLDRALAEDAWLAPDGSCTVPVTRVHARCQRDGLDAKKLGAELVQAGLWSLSADRTTMTCTWLIAVRLEGAEAIEQRRNAGRNSAKARAEKAAKKRATKAARTTVERPLNDRSTSVPDAAPVSAFPDADTHGNAFDDNDLNDRSTTDEHKTVDRSSSFSSRTNELLRSAGDAAPAATSPAASHAGGAAALVADPPPPPPATAPAAPRSVPDLRALMRAEECALQIAKTQVPAEWLSADVLELVHTLDAADTGVDVQRALFRLCSMHQKAPGDSGHLPLLDEIRAILDGADGRDGLVERRHAAAAIALALHGGNQQRLPVSPLLLRAIAVATHREVQRAGSDAEPRRIAVGVAFDFTKGHRQASGYTLPCDHPSAPERLMGYRVKAGAA